MKKLILLSLCFMLMSAGVAHNIHVPGDYSTIQEGINAANPGDTIIVSEGTYYEQLNFLGKKPLMVASEFLYDGDTSHIANTIIDGSQLNNPDSASVVYFINGEDSTSVLCGFTIQGGKGTITDLWDGQLICGAGIYINYSGASIRNNILQDNESNDTLSAILIGACGGGLFAYNGLTGWVVIKNNRVLDNRAISSHLVAEGGGLFVYNVNSRIMGNIIRNNLSQYTMTDGYCSGGGLQCMNDENIPFSGIMNNEISGNQALAADGSWGSYGGGAATWHHNNNSYIKNNTFSGNKSSIYGGGLDFFSYNQMVWNVENNYFIDNEALYGGGVDAFDSTSMIILKNNVFIKNTAYDQGGGIYINRNNGSPDEHPLISINNSFYDNQSYGAGGAIYAYKGQPVDL